MFPEKETLRVEAFSDAVFAIAITLLALELKRPMLDAAANNKTFWIRLVDSWPSFLTFFISFGTLLTLWVNHHGVFELIFRVNRALLFANGFLLMFIATVPFTTGLLTDNFSSPAAGSATAVYSGVFALINITYFILWHIASRDRSLLKADISEHSITHVRKILLIGIPAYIFAFILSFFSYRASLAILLLLWLYWAFQKRSIKIR